MSEQKDKETKPAEQTSNLIRHSDLILETSMDGFCVIGLDGKMLEVNSSLCDITGYSREELLKMEITDIEAVETPEEIAQHIDKVIRQGYDRFETKHRCKDGRIVDTEVSSQYCDLDEDRFFFCFFRDITDRKQAENDLQMERNKLDSIIGAMEDGLTIRNLEYEITYQNKVLDDIFGDHRGKKCYQVYAGKDQICDGCPVKLAFRDGTSHTSVREVTMPSGETAFWENTANPIKDTSGKIIACLEISKNITERNRIEMEREIYRDGLLKAQRRAYIGSIGSIVAHQVNQPLTKINILLDRVIEQIEEASCSPSALKNIKEGLAEARKAASIIRNFRQCSKDSDLEGTSKVNVSAVADRIVSVLSKKAKQAKMRISIKDLGDLPEVETNETALEQIFLIIVQNAVEATDGLKSHKLDITGKFADDNIELQFSDDCCGIAPENLDKIFELFFSTKTEDKGMGLGLDIVKQILISCGGHIRVESRHGKGTTFYVTLPISNALKP